MSRAAAKGAETVEALSSALVRAVREHGQGPRAVMAPAAAAVCLLGVDQEVRSELLEGAAASADPIAVVHCALEGAAQWFPYLRGHIDPLVDTLTNPGAVAASWRVLAGADLDRLVESDRVGGDLLGQLYMAVIAPGEQSGRGAFYTPASLAGLLTRMLLPEEGSVVSEPCVGCGGVAISAVRAMRAAGRTPETVTWVVGDVDLLALACAGVQMAAHGMPKVVLRPGDALCATPLRA